MKVYVTKYALSEGIREVECLRQDDNGLVKVSWPGAVGGWALFSKNDWAETKERAIAQADKKRSAKIASVKRQLAKLEAMTF